MSVLQNLGLLFLCSERLGAFYFVLSCLFLFYFSFIFLSSFVSRRHSLGDHQSRRRHHHQHYHHHHQERHHQNHCL